MSWLLLILYALVGLVLLSRVADYIGEKAPLVALMILWFGVGLYHAAQWVMS